MSRNLFTNRIVLAHRALALFDAAVVIISGYLVYFLRFGESLEKGNYQLFLIVVALLTVQIFSIFSAYKTVHGESINNELTRLTLAWVTVGLCIGALTFLTQTGIQFSRLWAGYTFLAAYIAIISSRVVFHAIVRYLRSKGYNQKRVVIIGAGSLGKRACDSLLRNPWVGIKPVAFFDDDESVIGQQHKNIKVLGPTLDVVRYIEEKRKSGEDTVDQVWFALPLKAATKIEALQIELQDTATKVYMVPDVFGFNLASYNIDEVAGLPILNMSASPMNGMNSMIKRFEDIILSFVLLLVLSPFFVFIAALIKLDSAGPVFFKQRRYGQDGREILVWKFRSMTVTEDGGDIKQAQRDDDRVTFIGGWLRKLSIDELPQLLNVFLGSMSLVGPRPHAVAHNEYYRKRVPGYMVRHQIKPGITGWAQINGCRGETAQIEQMHKRVQYDLEYIRNWTLFLDLRILLLTIPILINNKNTY